MSRTAPPVPFGPPPERNIHRVSLMPSCEASGPIRGQGMLPYLRGRGRAPMWRPSVTEAGMTREELASKLDHLDPGATLSVPEAVLAVLFGDGRLSKEAL